MIRRKSDSHTITTGQKLFPPSPTATAVLALLVVLFMLTTPGPVIAAITNLLSMPVMPPGNESQFPVDKVVHFVMFAACAFLCARAWADRLELIWIVMMLVVFAAATELLQIVIPGRSGDITDFLADAFGVLMGVWWYYRIKKTRLAKAGF